MAGFLIRPTGDMFVLEVVTSVDRSMPTSVTSHPIETGSSVSDHVILENKKWTLECVISDGTFNFTDETGKDNRASDAIVQYRKMAKEGVSVNVTTNRPNVGTGVGGRTSFTSQLKSIAGAQLGFLEQFYKTPIMVSVGMTGSQPLPPGKDGVSVTTSNYVPRAEKARKVLEEVRDKRELLTFIHSSGTFDNLVITNFEPKRDATISSHSLVFTLSLEQVQVIDKAKTVQVAKRKPKPRPAPKPSAAKKDLCSPEASTGKATGTETTASKLTKENPSALQQGAVFGGAVIDAIF